METYKLAMKLDDTDVTRTVTVPACMDFEHLHDVINKIFGFDNSHPWQFTNTECTLRLYCEIVVGHGLRDWSHWTTWPHLVQLWDVLSSVGKRIYYEYDFGDCWRVTIRRAANPKSDEVLCEKTTGTFVRDDIGGPYGLMSYRKRLAASTLDYPPDYDERTHDMSSSVTWWGCGCRATREKFLAGPDKDEITSLLKKSVGQLHDRRMTSNARYFRPAKQPFDAEWSGLAADVVRQKEIASRYDAQMRAWAEVVSTKIMPLAANRALEKKAAVQLGLCSQDKKKVIVENKVESDVLYDYIVMMLDAGNGTLAKRFVDSAAKSGDDKERSVARLLATYRYRALRVKNVIPGLGVVVTDLFENRDHLLVNLTLSKDGDKMEYATFFGGVVDMGGFLASTSSLLPYDLANVESLIDGNLSDLELPRSGTEPLTPPQMAQFAAKMTTDLVESGFTSRIMANDM